MAVRITPEPSPEEREALLRAMADADVDRVHAGDVSPWWQAGIREAVEDEPPED